MNRFLTLLGLLLPVAAAALEINTATRAQLEQLNGLGVATVERILQAREQRPFADWARPRRACVRPAWQAGRAARTAGADRERQAAARRTRKPQMTYQAIDATIGNTPLVRLQRIGAADNAWRGNVILGKLEGNNPGGSVKDRPAYSMIARAEERGEIKPGDRLIEATSGNTGIALAMIAAMKGYRMTLIMPDNLSAERRASMTAYGAELILTPVAKGGMEYARDMALADAGTRRGRGARSVRQPDNPRAHYETTGPEIWRDTDGRITHFVSAMGTTGTIMGVSRCLKEKDPKVQIVGAQPAEGSQIPGHPQVVRGVPAEDLRRFARRPPGVRDAGRSRGDGASIGLPKKASSAAFPPRVPLPDRAAHRCRSP